MDALGGPSSHVGLGNVWWGLMDVSCGPLWSDGERAALLNSLKDGIEKDGPGRLASTNCFLLVVEQFVGVQDFGKEGWERTIWPVVSL